MFICMQRYERVIFMTITRVIWRGYRPYVQSVGAASFLGGFEEKPSKNWSVDCLESSTVAIAEPHLPIFCRQPHVSSLLPASSPGYHPLNYTLYTEEWPILQHSLRFSYSRDAQIRKNESKILHQDLRSWSKDRSDSYAVERNHFKVKKKYFL